MIRNRIASGVMVSPFAEWGFRPAVSGLRPYPTCRSEHMDRVSRDQDRWDSQPYRGSDRRACPDLHGACRDRLSLAKQSSFEELPHLHPPKSGPRPFLDRRSQFPAGSSEKTCTRVDLRGSARVRVPIKPKGRRGPSSSGRSRVLKMYTPSIPPAAPLRRDQHVTFAHSPLAGACMAEVTADRRECRH
jgi:hypothetical protein